MNTALRYAARSDIGLGRYKNNQDSGFAGPNLLVVADGMGGHAGGDIASSLAVGHLAPLDGESFGPEDALDALESALEVAHDDMRARAVADPQLSGLGTTVVALLHASNKLAMVHIGDSRAYLLRDGQLAQVTVDHTFVQYLVDTGRISPQEAETHPQRSVVLRVLGDFDMDLELDLSVREARPGDRWLLCSDGLSGVISPDTLTETLAGIADVDECADTLVQLALRGGGQDNITCVVADVIDLNATVPGTEPDTVPQVVGAAAAQRGLPTTATGPAARAAALTEPTKAVIETEDDVPPPPRWRRRLLWSILVALVVALSAGGFMGYGWTQSQYYLGVADGKLAIYQGIPQHLGPISLSTVFERTTTDVSTLPQFVQGRLEATITTNSLSDARVRVSEILELAPPHPGVMPSSTPSPATPNSAVPAPNAPAPPPSTPSAPTPNQPAPPPAPPAPGAGG